MYFISFYMFCLWWMFQQLLFNPTKPFSRGPTCISQDVDLMIDCFLSCFRITPHNNDLLKICLSQQSPSTFHFVLVNVLHRIITQVRPHEVYSHTMAEQTERSSTQLHGSNGSVNYSLWGTDARRKIIWKIGFVIFANQVRK